MVGGQRPRMCRHRPVIDRLDVSLEDLDADLHKSWR
jgi:hypothetical protein